MLEIGLSAVATLFAVIVIFLHKQWMNDTPVPAWLMHITCTSCYKSLKKKMRRGHDSTTTLVRSVGSINVGKHQAQFSLSHVF